MAQKIANEFEDIARRKRNARQVQRVFREIFEEITNEVLPDSTAREFGGRWLRQKEAEVSSTTFQFYQCALRNFLRYLGPKADAFLYEITKEDIFRWRDEEAKRISPTTLNHNLKFVRMLFAAAQRENLIVDNPAKDIPVVRRETRTTRRPFTIKEIRALLANADDEWKSMILFGLYTGQRLGDVAKMTWDQIDLQANEIRLQTGKTGRFQKIPISAPLRKHVDQLPRPAHGQGPLHPRADEVCHSQKKSGSLSIQFQRLMVKAGLIEERPHRVSEERPGRSGKRTESKISFHSLRHTTTSLLKNAGVSPAVAEEFVGHDSAEMNRVYTHIELDSMRKAAELLPDVTI